MKSFKILIAAAAATAVLFSGCTQKEVFTGIDSSKPGVTDFNFDETMSTETSVSFVWNPTQAIAAGATSFSVQLAQKEDFSDIDMYEPSVGQTVQADATVNDGVIFTGLKEYEKYYARVRANYPRSIYSDWTILKDGEDLACISVGHGVVSMVFSAPKQLNLKPVSESKFNASWSLVGPADAYSYEYKQTSESSWSEAKTTAVTSVDLADLKDGGSYDFRVRACRTVDGKTEYSDYISDSITLPQPNYITLYDKNDVLSFFSSGAAAAQVGEVYKLTKDVDLGGETIAATVSFVGALDGQGFTISNAVVPDNLFATLDGSVKDVKFAGLTIGNSLIGSVSSGGSVSNVTIGKDCTVSFPEPADAGNYGTIAGSSAGKIDNCVSAAQVSLKFAALPKASCNWGGIVGYSNGTVSNCANNAKFAISIDEPASGTFHCFGGVVGMTEGEAGKVTVSNCTNSGDVSVEYGTAVYFYTGGVVGGTPSAKSTPGNYGIIEGCTNEGDVSMHYIKGGSGAYPNIGGVVGYTEGYVKSCTNKGNVTILCDSKTATWTCARLAGVGGTVTQGASDCHNYGKLSATALFAGGTAGNRGAGNIATSCFGGVIGSAGPYESDGSVVFEGCTNEVDLSLELGTTTETPNHHCGGVFGYVTGKIDNCQNKGNLTVTCPTAVNRLGGIAGGCKYEVSNCTNSGKVKIVHPAITKNDWRAFAAGIVADASTAGATTYTKCTNSGDISFESTATPATSKISAVGGIVAGGKAGSEITFTDCANTGKLSYTSPGSVVTGDLRAGDYN